MKRSVRFLAAMAVLAVALSACDWYQPGFNASNDGSSPSETAIPVGDAHLLTQDWSYVGAGTAAPVLVTGGGRVVGASGNTLTAVDAGSGALAWQATDPDDTNTQDLSDVCGGSATPLGTVGPIVNGSAASALAVSCAQAGLHTSDKQLGSVDLASGDVTWTDLGPSVVPGSIVVGEAVYNGTLYRSGVSGVVEGPSVVPVAYLTDGANTFGIPATSVGQPAMAHQRAFMTASGKLYAITLAPSGSTPAWSAALTTATATPSTDDSQVYVTDGSVVKAFDQATGSLLWSTTLPATGSTDAPAVANGEVFVRTSNQVVALDAATGAVRWTGSLGSAGTTAAGLGSPSVADGVVYVGSQDGYLLAFDAQGTSGCAGSPTVCSPLVSLALGGAPGASRPVIADGSVLIGALRAGGNVSISSFTPHYPTIGSSIASAN